MCKQCMTKMQQEQQQEQQEQLLVMHEQVLMMLQSMWHNNRNCMHHIGMNQLQSCDTHHSSVMKDQRSIEEDGYEHEM